MTHIYIIPICGDSTGVSMHSKNGTPVRVKVRKEFSLKDIKQLLGRTKRQETAP